MLKGPDHDSDSVRFAPAPGTGHTAGPGSGPPTGADEGAAAGSSSADPLQLLSHVLLAFATSGLRYWGRTAELWAKALPSMAQGLAEMRGQQDGGRETWARLLDELRAYVRDLAELPGQEARRLQAELDRIASGLHAGSPPADQQNSDAPWRRWEMKP